MEKSLTEKHWDQRFVGGIESSVFNISSLSYLLGIQAKMLCKFVQIQVWSLGHRERSREINLQVICLAWRVFKARGLDDIIDGMIKQRGEV